VCGVIQRAGGLTSVANVEGNLQNKRPIQAKQIEDLENVNLNLKKDSIQNKLEKN
jgi:protein involved in polysaccharide export with SLBB domain